MSDMQGIKDLLATKKIPVLNTVNSSTVNGSSNNCLNTSTVNSIELSEDEVKFRRLSDFEKKMLAEIYKVLKDSSLECDYHANIFAEYFNDKGNIFYYHFLVKNNNVGLLYLCLGLTKEAAERGLIRKSPFLYFKYMLKAKGGITEKSDLKCFVDNTFN